ncbi:MAG: DUF4124 domain-containing protein [Gammaproteobacteria bacterium]
MKKSIQIPLRPTHLSGILTLALMLIITVPAIGSGIYKWTDKDGKIHYGGERPEEVQAEQMKLHISEPSPSPEKSNDNNDVGKANLTVDDKAKKERVVYCKSERKRLKTAEKNTVVYEKDATGKVIKLASNERNQRINKIKANINKYCK